MFFSIVITTYNAENFIVEALNSLKNQTFQDFDCVITDDCSTDKTIEICKTWLAKNPEFFFRTEIIESSKNTGVSANVNRGLSAASSEWIHVLSADDMLPKNSLEYAHQFIVSNPNISIFQGIAAVYKTDFSSKNFVKFISQNEKTSEFFAHSAQRQHQQLIKFCRVVAPAVFYKKSIVKKVGFCDESIPMMDDWPLWKRLTKAGYKFYFLNEIVVNYRLHEHSIMAKKRDFLFGFINVKKNGVAKNGMAILRFFKRNIFRVKTDAIRNPRHIAVFLQNFKLNGYCIVCANYVDLLIKNGYSVDLIVANEEGDGQSVFPEQANIVNLGNVRVRQSICKLRRYLKKTTASTLICIGNLPNFAGALATFRLQKEINLILSQHGFTHDLDDKDIGFVGKITPFLKRKLYPRANHVIAVSTAVSNDLKQLKIPSKKITTIPNFVNINHIKKLSEQPISQELPKNYIAFVGRLARVKNIDLLIQAMTFLDDDLHLIIVGNGSEHRHLNNLVQTLNLTGRVHFLDVMPNVLPILKNAKVVAIPSFSESFSMIALESAVLGKTVVHTPNTGCLEIFGTDGSYCSETFDNPKEFANTIQKALKNPINSDILTDIAYRFSDTNAWPLLEKTIKNS
jgi:alpha-1,3-rhamnosyltransferase